MSTFCVIAKACGSGVAPENTCAAVAAAQRVPLPSWARLVVEVDVRFSADGVAMALHDATLERCTNGAGRVDQHSATQLKRLRVGGGDEAVATLSEILEAAGDTELVFDVHDASASAAARIVGQIRQHPAQRILIASEHTALVNRVRALAPRLRTAATPRQAWRKLACDAARLSFLAPRGCTWMVPEHHRGVRVVTPRFVANARRHGDDVWVYVVDDVEVAQKMRKMGVNGCFTTTPSAYRDSKARSTKP